MKFKYVFLLFVLFIPLVSCDKERDDDIEYVSFDKELFQTNRDKWDDLNIQNYSYEFGYSEQMLYKISVRNGEVSNIEVLIEFNPESMTIEQIFNEILTQEANLGIIQNDIGRSYLKEIKVEYDSEYFFPREVEYVLGTIEPVEIDGFFKRDIKNFVIED